MQNHKTAGMPPQKRIYFRPPPTQLQDQIQTLIRNLSPDVADQLHKLVEATRRLKTYRDRETHCLILNEWNRHKDESRLSHFMTKKMAQVIKRLEQEGANRIRILDTDTGREYRKHATEYLRSNFSTDDLAQILNTKASLKERGSNIFKKLDADMLAKCPEVFKSVEEVKKWRIVRSSLSLKSLILRVLPSDFSQTLSTHSASESGLDSLARAAELRLAADRNGAESDEPQDGSNRDHHDMGNFNIPPSHDPSPSAEGDHPSPSAEGDHLSNALAAAAENSDAFDNGINGANEVTSRECQKRRRPSGEVAEDAAAASRTEGEVPKYPHFEVHPFFSSCPSAIEHRLTGPRRAHVPIGSSRLRH
jgi:hypothetical protein